MSRSFNSSVSAAVVGAGQNVHAVGVGYKVSDGQVTTQLCVRLYVVQKLAESLLPPRDLLPKQINGVPTDVIESPPAFIHAKRPAGKGKKVKAAKAAQPAAAAVNCTNNRRQRIRPLVAGISTAHRNVTAGTLSYFCRSTRSGDDPNAIYILSNNHVYADVNQSAPGDDLYQPGPADGGIAADHVAELRRFVRMHVDGTTPNFVDAAIGELLPGIQYTLELCSIGRVQGTATASEEMVVCMHGRTTGYSEGIVDDISYDALVGMDHEDDSVVAQFNDQLRIRRVAGFPTFGLGGDSGSLVVEKQGKAAIGLYFAGPENGSYGVANQIDDVLNELEIELL